MPQLPGRILIIGLVLTAVAVASGMKVIYRASQRSSDDAGPSAAAAGTAQSDAARQGAARAEAGKASAPATEQRKANDAPFWPEFHGPGRTNIAPEKGLLRKWPPGGPPLLWKYSACGEGYSGVSIADGMIFTAGDFDDDEYVIALSLEGKLLWRSPNGAAWRRASPGSRTTPTYNEGRLYHMNPSGRLACYDARSGKELWAVDLKAEFDAQWGIWGLAENVVVDGDRVLCAPGGTKGRIVALDKRTGKTLWVNTEIDDTAAYCSPVVVVHQGVRQLLTLLQRTLVAVDVQTGKLLWSVPFVPRTPQNALPPLYHQGLVFVACGHSSGGTLFKIEQEKRTASIVWHRQDLDNCHGGSLLIDGKLFGSACRQGGRHFYCVDFFTGKTIQLDNTLGKVALACADGMLYCLNHQGTMSLLAVKPEGFQIVSQFELKRKPANSYLAHPVICGGRMYIRSDQDLMVYNVRAPQEDSP